MKPTQAMKALDWLTEGENLRPVAIDEGIRELCHSICASGLLQPISAVDHGTHGEPFIGFRRLAALRWGRSEGLAIPEQIPVMIYPPTITPGEKKIAQITENIQRADVTDIQLYGSVSELKALGMTLADIAAALGKSKPSVCRYFAPDNGPQEAREHFLAGRLTLGQCYKISTSEDAAAVMAVFLGGGTHEKADQAARPKDGQPKEKAAKVRIPLAVSTDHYEANGVVTVASLPGREIDLDGTEHLLRDALRAVKEAQKKGWTVKSAQGAWRDTATAS